MNEHLGAVADTFKTPAGQMTIALLMKEFRYQDHTFGEKPEEQTPGAIALHRGSDRVIDWIFGSIAVVKGKGKATDGVR